MVWSVKTDSDYILQSQGIAQLWSVGEQGNIFAYYKYTFVSYALI